MNVFVRFLPWVWRGLRRVGAATLALVRARSRATLLAAAGLGAGLGLLVIVGLAISVAAGLPGALNADALWAHNRQPGVTFLDRNGAVLGVRGPSYGERTQLSELPPHVPKAFLAIEDQRFYEHDGIDEKALARAAAANLSAGDTVQGGSTITQQLVKNLFLTPERTIRRKLQEIVLARRVERKLSKDDILELYLNRVYLGEQAYGVDAAARRYFRKPARELSLAEAALLAALPKAPSSLAPTSNFERAKERQRLVLAAMVETGAISEAEAKAAAEAPLTILPRRAEADGLGYVFDAAIEEAKALGGDLPADLVIQVTVEEALQRAAAKAMREEIGKRAQAKNPLQAALVTIDREGGVRAMLGGYSYGKSKFNRAIQAKRQPGSAFKLFVFAAAFEQGLSPDTIRFDAPIEIDGWSPKNYTGGFEGAVTLRTAFAKSLNTVAAEIAEEVGQEQVVDIANRLGLTAQIQPLPSIALGSIETNLMELTQAYAVFMRDGRRAPTHLVSRIGDSRGVTVYARPPPRDVQLLDVTVVRQMNHLLGRVVQSGTGTRARLPGRDVAGKTGTTSDYRDAWFIGFSAELTTGVWVGHDNYKPMPGITGSGAPAGIWARFMTAALEGVPPADIPGVDDPLRSDRQAALASFYQSLANALQRVPAPAAVGGGFAQAAAPAPELQR